MIETQVLACGAFYALASVTLPYFALHQSRYRFAARLNRLNRWHRLRVN
jgi:hypothetical protein